MLDLEIRLKNMTKAEQDEALMRELNRLLNKGVIDSELYQKAKRMWRIL